MSTDAAARNVDATRLTQGVVPLVGRVFLSAIFLLSGVSKLAAPGATIGYIASAGLPFPALGFAIAAIVEIGGGLALVLGYRTRLVAGVLAVFSIVTALAFQPFGRSEYVHPLLQERGHGGRSSSDRGFRRRPAEPRRQAVVGANDRPPVAGLPPAATAQPGVPGLGPAPLSSA
jgi:uncharacterized membrane protein YphA (DoxX/SURF4 family)